MQTDRAVTETSLTDTRMMQHTAAGKQAQALTAHQHLTSLVKYNFMTDDSNAERCAHHHYLAGAYHLLVFFNEACSLPSGPHNRPIDINA